MALLLITVIVDYMAILIVMKMTTILPEEMMLVMAIMIFQMILFLVLEREGEIQQVCVFQFNVQPIRLTNILTASHVLPRLVVFTPTYPPFYPINPYST